LKKKKNIKKKKKGKKNMPLLFIRLYTDKGRALTLDVDSDESIGSIKEKIGCTYKIPAR
jgi:hypothetical protein